MITEGYQTVMVVGIICEYDPFHKGHFRQIELARKNGADTVVCLMSGNATQRGCFACADKYVRAEAALASGADLVLELPYPYSSSAAEYFAAAGVCILASLGVDELNFGSECGDIDLLIEAAAVTASDEYALEYRKILEANPETGSAEAYAKAYLSLTGRELPTSPNDMLGVSYCRAAIKAQTGMKLSTVKREGAGYSDTCAGDNEYPSATSIRWLFEKNEFDKAFSYMPKSVSECFTRAKDEGLFPSDVNKLETAILSFFRLAEADAFDNIADASDGLGRRLISAAKNATSLEEFYREAATKRYTDARIRRAALYCMTGVTVDDLRRTPEYTVLLAANRRGRAFLSKIPDTAPKIVTKPADAPAGRQAELSAKLDALYTLSLPKSLKSNEFLRRRPKISEND